LIGASLDGELDFHTALRVDEHVSGCRTCSAFLERLQRLSGEIAAADLDWSAEVNLQPLAASIRRENGDRWWKRAWLWRSALATIAAVTLIAIFIPARPGSLGEQQIVDNHVRSLLANHLVDVRSSDRHTVKPWFQGKLNFSPAVPDLSAKGFALLGGRLDVIAGKQAAALVYKRREHVVNLSMQPVEGSDQGVEAATIGGFHLLHWRKAGILYWAVSDLNETELREFAELMRAP